MATIYRFVIEQKTSGESGGRKGRTQSSKGTTAKKGRYVSLFGGEKGGVEHNRKLRAINPLLNRATNGVWEKGMRVGRAASGLITKNTETGALGISGVAAAIIISFVIQTLIKWQNKQIQIAERQNAQNFKQLENGYSQVNGAYKVSVNMFNGRYTYNQNK